MGWGEVLPVVLVPCARGGWGVEQSRGAAGEALGQVPAPALTQTHMLCQPEFLFLGRAVPGFHLGELTLRWVCKGMVCAGLGTHLFSVRVLQGGLLVATKEPFLKSCGSVQLTCPTVRAVCPWRSHSHWNRQCMGTGNLSAAKAFGYTAPHPPSGFVCVNTAVPLLSQ